MVSNYSSILSAINYLLKHDRKVSLLNIEINSNIKPKIRRKIIEKYLEYYEYVKKQPKFKDFYKKKFLKKA